jgi:cell wall-associated NlpC family hydrolase
LGKIKKTCLMALCKIITPAAGMYNKPDDQSGRETDALFGEEVEVLSERGDWAEVILKTDGYQAWIQKNNLGDLPEATHHIIAPRALITVAPDIKSPAAGYFPMGSRVMVSGAVKNRMIPIQYINGQAGYIMADHVLPIGDYVKDYVTSAESLMGTPYRWGGRDSFGFDCSALVQLSMATAGMPVPRNSGDQEKTIGTIIDNVDELRRGDLVFWKGHVGIMRDAENLLHTNMWHGMTASENLRAALPRLEKAAGSITRLARPDLS